MGVVVRRYIDFLILLIPTPLVSALFCSSIPTFCSFFKMFFVLSIIAPPDGRPVVPSTDAAFPLCTAIESLNCIFLKIIFFLSQ